MSVYSRLFYALGKYDTLKNVDNYWSWVIPISLQSVKKTFWATDEVVGDMSEANFLYKSILLKYNYILLYKIRVVIDIKCKKIYINI